MFDAVINMFQNIRKEKGVFFSTLISMALILGLVNLMVGIVMNIQSVKSKTENLNQVIVYVQTMTEEEITEFQTKLFKTPGVESPKFESREQALKELEKILDFNLSQEENPLTDAFYIHVSRSAQIDQLEQTLKSYPEVIELDMRTEEITNINKFSQNMDKLILFGSIGTLIFGFILISNISGLRIRGRKEDMVELSNNGMSISSIRASYFLETLLLLFLSSLLAFYAFYRLNRFIVSGVNLLNAGLFDYPTRNELISIYFISLIAGFLITLIVNFIGTRKYFKLTETITNIKIPKKPTREMKERNVTVNRMKNSGSKDGTIIKRSTPETRTSRKVTTNKTNDKVGNDEFFKKYFKKNSKKNSKE